MKNRIKEVMEYANLSQQDFAARLGISAASLSSIFTGRTNPTNNHVSAIHRAFPEINVNWIMFGEGNMICGKAQSEEQEEGAIDLEGDGAERMLFRLSFSTNHITFTKHYPINIYFRKCPMYG